MKPIVTIRRLLIVLTFVAMILGFRAYRIHQFKTFESHLSAGQLHSANSLVSRSEYHLPDGATVIGASRQSETQSAFLVNYTLYVEWKESKGRELYAQLIAYRTYSISLRGISATPVQSRMLQLQRSQPGPMNDCPQVPGIGDVASTLRCSSAKHIP